MRDKPESSRGEDPRTLRLAWWAAFLATLAVIGVLGIARSARALPLPVAGPVATAFAVSAPDEGNR
jgi:hypothetical protein